MELKARDTFSKRERLKWKRERERVMGEECRCRKEDTEEDIYPQDRDITMRKM